MSFDVATPADWRRSSVSKYCYVQLGKMLQTDPSGEDDELLPYLRAINISKSGVDLSHRFSMWIKPYEREKFRLQPDDVLVSEGGDAGRTAHFKYDGEYYFQNAINRVRPLDNRQLESRYLFYWFTFLKLAGYVDLICNVATIAHFTAEKVKAAPFALPPIDAQRRIAAFLDEKTVQIDGLIARKQALLERLAEKRQAIITQAVTKGLNPAAPMKESGIDWLGQIPAHWEVKRLKYVSPRVTVGIVVTPAAYYADEGILALRGLNIRPMGFDLTDTRNITEDGHALNIKSVLHSGDLVAVRTGAPGTTAIVSDELAGCNCIDLVIIRRPLTASPHYLGWFLNSDIAKTQYGMGAEGALQQHFNVETSKELVLTLPPTPEQSTIAEHIDATIDAHDRQSGKVKQSIERLQEYRAALITAAVTGQIEGLQ